MLLQCCCWSFSACSWASTYPSLSSASHRNVVFSNKKQPFLLLRPRVRRPKSSSLKPTCVGAELIDQIWQLPHNKVLVAAVVSAAIGQLSKPFTSILLYGKDLDFKATIQAGGFPSTHSSAVVATATTIGLERGLSDSIFGLTVVYAGLVMYDAQGVRREVGNHSKVLNQVLDHTVPTKDTDDVIDAQSGTSYPRSLESLGQILSREAGSISSKPTNSSLLLQPDDKRRQTSQAVLSTEQADVEEERTTDNLIPLKESIGHTEIEVTAGALLGFFVSLAVYTIM